MTAEKPPIAYRYTHPTTGEVTWLNPADVAVVTEQDQMLAIELESVRATLRAVHSLASSWKRLSYSDEIQRLSQILLDTMAGTYDASSDAVLD